MTRNDNSRQATAISRRQLLRRGVGGALLLTPLGWLAAQPAEARLAPAARPLPADQFAADVALAWFAELLHLIRETPGFSPPVASRAIGYAGVTLYETVVDGMPDHVSLAGLLSGLSPLPPPGRSAAYHWPSVANAALAELFRLLFPGAPAARMEALDRLEATHDSAPNAGLRRRSVERGRSVAQAVFHWSKSDGGHEGYLRNFPVEYVAPVGPGLWQPTPPGFQAALQPLWGTNRPFMADPEECMPEPPPAYSTDPSSAFFAEAFEVYQAVNQLMPEQRAIAHFWSDDPGQTATPPGHSISILTQLLSQQGASLATAAETYARLGIALADSFIGCWHVKYQHNLLRPITYVQAHIDPSWGDPLPLVTPPFPEYTSGHSVQSAAAAQVLAAHFGKLEFIDHTHDDRGLPARSFSSFDEMAAEAAISRLYGGIHFRAAIDRGLDQGRCIGRRAVALAVRR
jgi:hypothetical protein